MARDLTRAVLDVVRKRMEEQGVSGRGLAAKAGLPQMAVSRKLRAQGDFSVDDLDAVALALGARDAEELMAEARRHLSSRCDAGHPLKA